VSALAADYLIWVRDANYALLWGWQGGEWTYVETLNADQYAYRANVNDGQTDLVMPFNSIGLTQPDSTTLKLVAYASEETALRLWAVMPNANPVSSDQVVATGVYAEGAQTFALSQAFGWDNVGAGVCPNGSDGLSQSYADVDASLADRSHGRELRFLGDNLFWLWALLTPADLTSYLGFMSTQHPRIGGNRPSPHAHLSQLKHGYRARC
jgi:hypothetical protein